MTLIYFLFFQRRKKTEERSLGMHLKEGLKHWNYFSRLYILKQELVCSIIFTEQNCH